MIIEGKILSLDLATQSGFCVGAPDNPNPEFGEFLIPPTSDDVGTFGLTFAGWLKPLIDQHKPELIIFEAPILPQKTTPITARKLMLLAGLTEMMARHRKITCREGRASTVKKFFAGKGNAQKADTRAMAKRYGWNVKSDDAADACALWAYAVCCFAPQHVERFALGGLNARPMF